MCQVLLLYAINSTIRTRKKGNIKMNISKTRSLLYGLAKLLGDINAVQKGKVGQRIVRRQEGKFASRGMSKANKKMFGGN